MSLSIPGNAHDNSKDRTLLVRAYNDPVIFRDERVFRTLLRKESNYLPSSQIYFTNAHVQPEMRKQVADWMLDVCEHQSLQNRNQTCPPEVFCLAMNYMDRFLGICSNISSSQLQLLGAVCLMVAWKVREHEPLSAQRLVEYSDFTLTLDDIMEWEVLLLSKLEWDMSAVIAFDFVEHIIQRLEKATCLDNRQRIGSLDSLRRHSETLITMCSSHHSFSNLSPCLIATACVLTTLRSSVDDPHHASGMSTSTSTQDSSVTDMSISSASFSSSVHSTAGNSAQTTIMDLEKIFEIVEGITLLDKISIEKCIGQIDKLMKDNMIKSRCQGVGSPVQISGRQAYSEPLTSTPVRPPRLEEREQRTPTN